MVIDNSELIPDDCLLITPLRSASFVGQANYCFPFFLITDYWSLATDYFPLFRHSPLATFPIYDQSPI